MALRLEMARAANDDAELGDALDALADGTEDPRVASEMLVEAAQAAARVGDAVRSLARAQRAAATDPARASTQLFARGLEYRTRGAGTLDEARATIEELAKVEGALDAEDEALKTFLSAEALTVLGRTAEALQVLGAAYATVGAQPLVALGMGERLYANTDFSGALPLLQAALAGNLLGFRSRGVVALSAADAAIRGDKPALALELLEEATFDSETRPTALKRTAQLAASLGDTVRSRAVLLELARSASAEDRALTLAQLGRLLCASREPADQMEGERAFIEAIAAAPEGSILNAQLVAELETLKGRSLPPVPLMEGTTETIRHPAPPVEVLHKTSLAELEAAIGDATAPDDRIRARRMLARAHAERGANDSAEAVLWEAIAEGSLEAGDELANLLEGSSARTSDLLRIRRMQADLAPGDLQRLEALRSAALGDHNPQYARAVEHVARALDAGAGPLPPPALVVQAEQPGMLALLAHPEIPGSAFLDALALVWEGAGSLFFRDPASYGIAGIDHVTPGGPSPVSRLYEVAMRLLEAPKIPLYVRRAAGNPAPSVALLSPAAAILSGDTSEETGHLRFALGQALASALPQNVLVTGLADREARVMWRAMLGAFGPPELGRQLDVPSARLAESFWQTLSSKSQRRLQELLRSAPPQDFDAIAEAVRQSARRVGLFISGDFGLAVRTYLAENGHDPAALIHEEGLTGLCARLPVVADLHRLAVSPEYADARWHPMPVQSPNGPPSTGRFRFSRPA
ncbi:MAG: Exonuclease SbcC [Myxococcaceae bacterium]|nr:Exonuclease SbcC [Myxococcaceae bacterium]